MKKLITLVAILALAAIILADPKPIVLQPWSPSDGMAPMLRKHPDPGQTATMQFHMNKKQFAAFWSGFTNFVDTSNMPTGTLHTLIIDARGTNGAANGMIEFKLLDQ